MSAPEGETYNFGNAGSNTTYPYLSSLNPAQLKAVTSPPDIPLQILAGPGSGKTRVLTSRVAYLVHHYGYQPNEITAITFTNKAAAEMKKRLKVLLGVKQADLLVLGTFHATCAKYLRRYGQRIDLANNFAIADADDCKKIMSALIKDKEDVIASNRMQFKDSAVLSEISKAKAKEESPDGMAIRAAQDPRSSTSTLTIIAELYAEYEIALREANSLDFDDLLVFGLKLFRKYPEILSSCRHILVDEFQDTNTTQYELMKCFAKSHGGVSVVGDPDQSIYGWRSAEVENLNKMTDDFPGVQAIHLEENYRSTGAILAASLSVVTQDRHRIPKNLYTAHPSSTTVTLKNFSTPVIEASFIATEIKRMIAYSGSVLNYGDFAILLRYNALSRVIESALQKDSIPNKIVGGLKFFERMEVKDLLAYLQLADNPNFTPAFLRVINTPKRSIGDKSVAELMAAAKKLKITPMELSERIIDGDTIPVGVKPAIKSKLAEFVGVVRKLRRAAAKGTSVDDLIKMTVERTRYEAHLREKYSEDADSRWENVQELRSYSATVADEQVLAANPVALEEGFLSANSAAVEAMVSKEEVKSEKPLHHIFRRKRSTSGHRSRSNSVIEEKAKTDWSRRNEHPEKVDEEIIEILSSDDDFESNKEANLTFGMNGNGRSNGQRSEVRAKTNIDEDLDDDLDDPSEMEDRLLPAQDNPDDLTPLRFFLQRSMLDTDTSTKEKSDTPQLKVTITTVHAAKGLEWPVIFIPAVEDGTYPSYRCTEEHEVAEERRLLYVAMTRAQSFLTISYCQFRMIGGKENVKELSEFVMLSNKRDPTVFSSNLPEIDVTVRQNIASILGRERPDEAVTKDLIMRHVRAAPPLSMWDAPEANSRNFNRFARRETTKAARAAEYWASDHDEYALPDVSSSGMANASRGPSDTRGSGSGFISARLSRPNPYSNSSGPASPKPPPIILKSSNRDLPAPVPFDFMAESSKPGTGLGNFTTNNNSSLAAMKSLGLPSATSSALSAGSRSGTTSPNVGGLGTSPQPPSVSTFQNSSSSSISAWKSLGVPESAGGTAGAGLGLGVGGGTSTGNFGVRGTIPLARGTKRLGMGRPAPWGAPKKSVME